STVGCHGALATPGMRGSPSAFTLFTASDPHNDAYLRLYSEASRKMLRRLRGAGTKEPSEAVYFQELQAKCLGCHATPPAEAEGLGRAEHFLAGIQCESCHGAAAHWELNHFRRGPKPASLTNLSDP